MKANEITGLKRSNSIDLVRIIIALTVAMIHAVQSFGGIKLDNTSGIAVFMEFFFMFSGFFMMSRINRMQDSNENAWEYTFHKIKGFFGPLCIAYAVQFLIHCRLNEVQTVGGVFQKLWHFKWEFFLLQCAGMIQNPQFNQDYLLGPAWYLSAMMIALLFAYPLAKHFRKVFIDIICPAALIIVYSGLIQKLGYTNFGNDFTFVVSDAAVRAFAATCGGAICYDVYTRMNFENMAESKVMTILDALCWLSIPLCIFLGIIGINDSNFFLMIPFGGVIIFAFSDSTLVSRTLNKVPSRISGFLGTASLYIYLAHAPIFVGINTFFPDISYLQKYLFGLLGTLAFSALLYIIDKKRKSARPIVIICIVVLIATFVMSVIGR